MSQQLLKRAPEHVPTLVIAGASSFRKSSTVLAESYLQKALLLSPQHAGARALLVRTYLASRQPARALEAIQPLVAAEPGSIRPR